MHLSRARDDADEEEDVGAGADSRAVGLGNGDRGVLLRRGTTQSGPPPPPVRSSSSQHFLHRDGDERRGSAARDAPRRLDAYLEGRLPSFSRTSRPSSRPFRPCSSLDDTPPESPSVTWQPPHLTRRAASPPSPQRRNTSPRPPRYLPHRLTYRFPPASSRRASKDSLVRLSTSLPCWRLRDPRVPPPFALESNGGTRRVCRDAPRSFTPAFDGLLLPPPPPQIDSFVLLCSVDPLCPPLRLGPSKPPSHPLFVLLSSSHSLRFEPFVPPWRRRASTLDLFFHRRELERLWLRLGRGALPAAEGGRRGCRQRRGRVGVDEAQDAQCRDVGGRRGRSGKDDLDDRGDAEFGGEGEGGEREV